MTDDMRLPGGGGTTNLTTGMKQNNTTPTELHASIKLGIDAHAKWYYVARQVDGATPQPVLPGNPAIMLQLGIGDAGEADARGRPAGPLTAKKKPCGLSRKN